MRRRRFPGGGAARSPRALSRHREWVPFAHHSTRAPGYALAMRSQFPRRLARQRVGRKEGRGGGRNGWTPADSEPVERVEFFLFRRPTRRNGARGLSCTRGGGGGRVAAARCPTPGAPPPGSVGRRGPTSRATGALRPPPLFPLPAPLSARPPQTKRTKKAGIVGKYGAWQAAGPQRAPRPLPGGPARSRRSPLKNPVRRHRLLPPQAPATALPCASR